MYNNVLQGIENVAVWPVVSFVIFFLFFICLLWWVFTADKKYIQYMENLPTREAEVFDNLKVSETYSNDNQSSSQNP